MTSRSYLSICKEPLTQPYQLILTPAHLRCWVCDQVRQPEATQHLEWGGQYDVLYCRSSRFVMVRLFGKVEVRNCLPRRQADQYETCNYSGSDCPPVGATRAAEPCRPAATRCLKWGGQRYCRIITSVFGV